MEDPDSPGFDSSFPPSYEDGCVDRVCCEENCCEESLVFDTSTSFCVPDTCSDKEFVLFVPNGYREDRTMSSDDVQDMYECCSRGNKVVLNRIWESSSEEEDGEDSIQLCPGNGVTMEGNVYTFTLSDDRIVMFTCDIEEGQCEVSGDGLESDTGGNCQKGDDCISGFCYIGDYLRECVCSDTYGCESNQVCLDCHEFYRQSTATSRPKDCGDPDTTAQYTCYLKLGEACQEFGGIECETGFCENGICVCSPVTDYPCDEETERCIDSTCQTIPDGCKNEAFVLDVPYVYGTVRTMSSDDVQDMYDCCNNGGNVDMIRSCVHYFGSSEIIKLCPGNGTTKEGNIYNFTLSDDRIVTFSCNDEGACVVTGDESDTGENCCAGSDCISGSCHLGEYIGGVCQCTEDYGCEPNEVCVDACADGGGEYCDRPNHVVRYYCELVGPYQGP